MADGAATPTRSGLAIGTRAPDFELPWISGGSATLRGLLESNRPLLLVFSDPGCGPCNALLPELGRLQRVHFSTLNITFISSGDLDANRAKAREFRLSQVLLQKQHEVATRFQYAGTSSAVLIGADGLMASPVVAGADALRALVARTVSLSASVPATQYLPVVA